jgi:hypothetical protein
MDVSAARGADVEDRVRHFLALVKTGFTSIAKVFVGWHSFPASILDLLFIPAEERYQPVQGIDEKGRACVELGIFLWTKLMES